MKDGEPCGHPGCLNHVTHPCEGCGRVAGRTTFYRYDGYSNLIAEPWYVVKETPGGWWIRPTWGYFDGTHDKFILKNAIKRYAQPTKELALESYIARKRRQIKILEARLAQARDGLRQAESGFVDGRQEPEPAPKLLQYSQTPAKQPPCWKCGGTGEVSYYFDAGDHFGGSAAPSSGWETEPCPVCSKKARL